MAEAMLLCRRIWILDLVYGEHHAADGSGIGENWRQNGTAQMEGTIPQLTTSEMIEARDFTFALVSGLDYRASGLDYSLPTSSRVLKLCHDRNRA